MQNYIICRIYKLVSITVNKEQYVSKNSNFSFLRKQTESFDKMKTFLASGLPVCMSEVVLAQTQQIHFEMLSD